MRPASVRGGSAEEKLSRRLQDEGVDYAFAEVRAPSGRQSFFIVGQSAISFEKVSPEMETYLKSNRIRPQTWAPTEVNSWHGLGLSRLIRLRS